MNRSSFLLAFAAVGGKSNILGMLPECMHSPAGGLTTPAEDQFDFQDFYIAVAREFDGSVTLSALVNNKLKERQTFEIDDAEGIANFINMVGLARILFIDWHGARQGLEAISVHEVTIDWEVENTPPGLQILFRECAELLSCPTHPEFR